MKITGYICSSPLYEYDGGKRFYDMFERWYDLPDRESCRVGGGCEMIGG